LQQSTTAEEIVLSSEISPSPVYFSDIRGLRQNGSVEHCWENNQNISPALVNRLKETANKASHL